MELLSAALPNIMFAAGIIAIAIGLGIELKLVPIGSQVGRGGRIGAMTFGILLVSISVFLYIQEKRATTASTPTPIPPVVQPTQPSAVQDVTSQPIGVPVASTAPPISPPTMPAAAPGIAVPDVRGMRLKDAEAQFRALGLQIDVYPGSCADLGIPDTAVQNEKKDAVACQSPAPGTPVAAGTAIKIVLTDSKHKK
jgi:hypothetical protein